MNPIVITLRGEPKGKGRPRFVRATGKAFTPAATRSYESHLRLAAQEAMGARKPIEGPISVDVVALMPIPKSWSRSKRAEAALQLHRPTKKPDADNLMKVLDSLNEVVWRDDAQVVEAKISKRYSDIPSLKITVREIAPSFGEEANA